MGKHRKDRLSRLAKAIDALAERDEQLLREAERVDRLRPQGALMLHDLCRQFVEALNACLKEPAVTFDPPCWTMESFTDGAVHLFQINLRGRLLQMAFRSTDQLQSTEDFAKPYILEGAVRCFNQELLESSRVDEQQIFFCTQGSAGQWHYSDRRLYRTGLVTEDYLAGELERLL